MFLNYIKLAWVFLRIAFVSIFDENRAYSVTNRIMREWFK